MLVAEMEDYDGRVADHSKAVSKLLSEGYVGTDYTDELRAWKAALRSLTGVRRVIVPLDHPDFRFNSDEVSHGARLWTNMLGLVCTHAWLEQRDRQTKVLPGGERAIVATPEDYRVAYEIFKATCQRSVVNLSDTHRKILDAVHALTEEALDNFGDEHDFSCGFSQRKIAEKSQELHGKNYVRQATISENKTFLSKSAKLLWEPSDGGLALVMGADPSWWKKGDVLVGFPKPEEVEIWWEGSEATNHAPEKHARDPESTDRASDELIGEVPIMKTA